LERRGGGRGRLEESLDISGAGIAILWLAWPLVANILVREFDFHNLERLDVHEEPKKSWISVSLPWLQKSFADAVRIHLELPSAWKRFSML
jgi:hypothetical protein